MTETRADAEVRQIPVPPQARALSTLPRIDYEDAFLVDVGAAGERTGEEWARAILDGSPRELRIRLWVAWIGLGLKLGAPWSRERVLGWPVRRSTADVALLGADSRIGMPGELLVVRQDPMLLFATFVQKQNRLAEAAWATVDRVHRPTVRHVLKLARRRVRDAGP